MSSKEGGGGAARVGEGGRRGCQRRFIEGVKFCLRLKNNLASKSPVMNRNDSSVCWPKKCCTLALAQTNTWANIPELLIP